MMPHHTSPGASGLPRGGRRRARDRSLGAWALVLLVSAGAQAQLIEDRPLSLYGAPGMLDMPSARFMPDGSLAITAASKQPDDRITIAFQALPWLEATARYSIIYDYAKFDPKAPDLFDRSLGLKARLMREGPILPELAIGVLDIGGTEVFGGEYIVASKKFGPVDSTLGLGFGRLGTRGMLTNPLALVSDRFKTRTPPSKTGTFAIKQLFQGEDASLFGGVVVDTPFRGLQLLAEYSGDHYRDEETRGIAKVLTPINFGISYRPAKSVEFGVGFLQGHILAGRLSLRTNFKNPPRLFKLDPPPPKIHVRTQQEVGSGRLDAGGTGIGVGVAFAATEPLNSAEIANPPDWTIFPPSFSSAAPDLQGASASARARFDAALQPLRYRVEDARIDGASLALVIAPTAPRQRLACDELWKSLPVGGLSGIESVAATIRPTGPADARCVKFLAPRGAPIGEGAELALLPKVLVPKSGWWDDRAYMKSVADAVATTLKRQRLMMESVKLTQTEAIIHFKNPTYPSVAKGIGRAARGLTSVLPPSIEMITLVLTTGNLNGTKVSIPRGALERAANGAATSEEVFAASSFSPASPGLSRSSFTPAGRFPSIRPIFVPAYRQNLFDPDDPLRIQLFWRGGLDIELFRGVIISGVYDADIYNNFDTIKRGSGSQLPHVRSDVVQYLQQGSSGLEKLELTYLRQIAPEIYGRLTAGYLEDMYGGVDAEILFRPFGKRWAIGVEAAQVYKRDFDRKFGFQDFETTTGHVSIYYESPWYGLNFNVHGGRYLAGDWGATFELARRFDNGAEVSAFATFTDVPFNVYGEGSFDKGISIRFPFDLTSFFSTQQSAKVTFRPLTRDGGARLEVDHRLYEETRGVSYGETVRNWGDLLAQR